MELGGSITSLKRPSSNPYPEQNPCNPDLTYFLNIQSILSSHSGYGTLLLRIRGKEWNDSIRSVSDSPRRVAVANNRP
jgi:hypothetical protein